MRPAARCARGSGWVIEAHQVDIVLLMGEVTVGCEPLEDVTVGVTHAVDAISKGSDLERVGFEMD